MTDTSVVLKPDGNVDSYTYSYKMVLKDNKAKAADLTSDTGEFPNLTPDTDYLAYIIVKGNDQHNLRMRTVTGASRQNPHLKSSRETESA